MPLGCRNNLSYGRYWEGRSKLQDITANLSDAVRTAINFDRNAVPKEKPTPEQTEQHEWFCDTFVHLISLFHGVALATLRGDYDMENLVVCWCPPPAACMAIMHGLTRLAVEVIRCSCLLGVCGAWPAVAGTVCR